MTETPRALKKLEKRLLECSERGDMKGAIQEFQRWEQSRCGASTKTRGGDPCRARALANGRCVVHGGLSSGPNSLEGRRQALLNLRPFRHLRGTQRVWWTPSWGICSIGRC